MAWVKPNITTSGTTWAQLQAGGASALLEKLITANYAATSAPSSAATATATGGGSTGGSLGAGTYYFVFTETNGFGETTAAPVSAQLTVSAGNQPQFTFPSLQTGNTARNLYLTAISGASTGPFYLYATGITTTTSTASAAAPSNSFAVQPPTINTTGFSFSDANSITTNEAYSMIRSVKDGNSQDVYRYLRNIVAEFLQGEPVTFNGITAKLRHAALAYSMFAQVCNEIGTLVDSNAGTLGTATTGIGGVKPHRTWP